MSGVSSSCSTCRAIDWGGEPASRRGPAAPPLTRNALRGRPARRAGSSPVWAGPDRRVVGMLGQTAGLVWIATSATGRGLPRTLIPGMVTDRRRGVRQRLPAAHNAAIYQRAAGRRSAHRFRRLQSGARWWGLRGSRSPRRCSPRPARFAFPAASSATGSARTILVTAAISASGAKPAGAGLRGDPGIRPRPPARRGSRQKKRTTRGVRLTWMISPRTRIRSDGEVRRAAGGRARPTRCSPGSPGGTHRSCHVELGPRRSGGGRYRHDEKAPRNYARRSP